MRIFIFDFNISVVECTQSIMALFTHVCNFSTICSLQIYFRINERIIQALCNCVEIYLQFIEKCIFQSCYFLCVCACVCGNFNCHHILRLQQKYIQNESYGIARARWPKSVNLCNKSRFSLLAFLLLLLLSFLFWHFENGPQITAFSNKWAIKNYHYRRLKRQKSEMIWN